MPYNSPEIPTDFKAMTYRLDEAARQAQVRAQLKQAGIVEQAWLARQGRQAFNHVRRWLVTVSERLEQDALTHPSA
jgi:hypothetical protein